MQDDVFTIVSKDDWIHLCYQWDVDPNRGIKAHLDCPSDWNLHNSVLTDNVKRSLLFDSSFTARHGGLRDMALGSLDENPCGRFPDEMDYRQKGVPALQTQPKVS